MRRPGVSQKDGKTQSSFRYPREEQLLPSFSRTQEIKEHMLIHLHKIKLILYILV